MPAADTVTFAERPRENDSVSAFGAAERQAGLLPKILADCYNTGAAPGFVCPFPAEGYDPIAVDRNVFMSRCVGRGSRPLRVGG